MRQDIQNFSHIMDINTSEKLNIYFEFKIYKNPSYTFTINDIKLDKTSNNLKLDLLDDIVLKYKNTDKTCDGAIEICDFSIDNKHILPLHLHLATPPTHWLEKLEYWEFYIPSPFYAWYQKISGGGWVA